MFRPLDIFLRSLEIKQQTDEISREFAELWPWLSATPRQESRPCHDRTSIDCVTPTLGVIPSHLRPDALFL
jgi:hypothetical protein